MIKLLPFLKLLAPLVLIMGMTGIIIASIIILLLLVLIGQIIAAINYETLTFKKIFNISIHAVTLPIILVLANSLLPFKVPLFGLLCFILAGYYQWRGIKAAHQANINPPQDVDQNIIVS